MDKDFVGIRTNHEGDVFSISFSLFGRFVVGVSVAKTLWYVESDKYDGDLGTLQHVSLFKVGFVRFLNRPYTAVNVVLLYINIKISWRHGDSVRKESE